MSDGSLNILEGNDDAFLCPTFYLGDIMACYDGIRQVKPRGILFRIDDFPFVRGTLLWDVGIRWEVEIRCKVQALKAPESTWVFHIHLQNEPTYIRLLHAPYPKMSRAFPAE
jgi:hypothetical protein